MDREVSFTDQKPHIVTEEHLKARWGTRKNVNGFRCYLCGHTFELGDQFRWVYMGDIKCINILVCESCDGNNIQERWKERVDEFRSDKFWALRHY